MRVQECDCSVAAIKSQLEKWNDGHMGWEGGEKTAANIHIHPTCKTNTVTVLALFPIQAFSRYNALPFCSKWYMESYYSQFIENCKHSTNERDQARGAIAARLTLCLKTFQLQGSCSSSGGSDGVRCSQLHIYTKIQIPKFKYKNTRLTYVKTTLSGE